MNSSWSPGLGSLDTLPAELRLHIYDELALTQLDDATYITALQQVSDQLLKEVVHHHGTFWRRTILRFKISPEHERNSWLTVESNTMPDFHFRDIKDAISQGFNRMPYDLLKGIKVEIGAPSRTDQGQMLCVWKKCFDLAKFLGTRNSPFLAPLELCFVDTSSSASWFHAKKDLPQRSFPTIQPGCSIPVEEVDFMIALVPFVCLRGAVKVTITLSENLRVNLQRNSKYYGIVAAESLMQFRGPVGSSNHAGEDDDMRLERDDLYLRLETRLDFAVGRTANQLRLERFATWFDEGGIDSESPAEREVRRIAYMSPAPQDLVTHASHLKERYTIMRALNPLSLYHRFGPKQSWHTVDFDGASNAVRGAAYDGVIEDEWDPQAWYDKYQEKGLPSFNSRKSQNHVHHAVMGSLPVDSQSLDEIWKLAVRGRRHVLT